MERLEKYIVEKPLNEVRFEWYDGEGNKVEFGKHKPWMFQVFGEGIKNCDVRKVELSPFDYTSSEYPIVKIYCDRSYKINDDGTETLIDLDSWWKNRKKV
jgi:hypothetical protein